VYTQFLRNLTSHTSQCLVCIHMKGRFGLIKLIVKYYSGTEGSPRNHQSASWSRCERGNQLKAGWDYQSRNRDLKTVMLLPLRTLVHILFFQIEKVRYAWAA
jgi:hypothetical protein